jgi:hypothetical protein
MATACEFWGGFCVMVATMERQVWTEMSYILGWY